MSGCHSTYSGVAALDRTKTTVTGHAASHTHQVGTAGTTPAPGPWPTALTSAVRLADTVAPSVEHSTS